MFCTLRLYIYETEHELISISFQLIADLPNTAKQDTRRDRWSYNQRIKSPYHPFLPYHFRQLPKCLHPLRNARHIRLKAFAHIVIQRELEIEKVSVSANSVLDRFQGKDAPVQRTLFEVFREHNDKCVQLSGTDMAPATVQRYETSLKHTQDFVWETYHKKDILLDEVSRQFVEDYEFWLKTSKKCCHNTATKYLKNFKKIIRIALAKGWMKNDPFLEIRFSLDKVEPDFLEDSEIRKLISKEIDIPRLRQVRDIFVFCCFTGLAFSDIHGLRKEHIVEDSNGVRWIRKGRQKTKIMCNIPLMEVPLKILEKYSTNEYCRKHGVLFPVLCNQKMNAYLKELADICGIKKTLTTHVARHTFATFALANGVSIESVAKMLGHTNVQMTRHYARVLDRTVIREMSQIKMDFHFSI